MHGAGAPSPPSEEGGVTAYKGLKRRDGRRDTPSVCEISRCRRELIYNDTCITLYKPTHWYKQQPRVISPSVFCRRKAAAKSSSLLRGSRGGSAAGHGFSFAVKVQRRRYTLSGDTTPQSRRFNPLYAATAPLAQGSRGSRSICLAGSREVRSIRLSSSYSFSFSAAMPGSSLPSRNSKDAPPPVEICVILSAKPSFVTAETESPPPTIETAPEAATASATAKVHFANCGNSKTPMGPFQITVPAPLMAFAYASAVFSPMSMPISPSGMSIPFT